MKVSNEGLELTVVFRRYQTGNIAMALYTETNEPWSNATTNVDGLGVTEVAVKDYAENHGLYEDLLKAGIINPAHRTIESGYVKIPVCSLTEEAMAEAAFA